MGRAINQFRKLSIDKKIITSEGLQIRTFAVKCTKMIIRISKISSPGPFNLLEI